MATDDGRIGEIPAGQRLVQVRGLGASLSERLAARFYRLTWRTPLHGMRLKGKFPLKLLAAPEDPLAGDAEAGRAIIAGAIERLGESMPVGEASFSGEGIGPVFADHIQRFSWLRDLAAGGPREESAPVAEALVRIWLAGHGETVTDAGWRPDLWGWRILNWTAHAPLILSSTDHVYRSAVLNSLARGARHLDRTADRATAGLPRMAAWAGIVAAGLLIPGGNPRKSFGEAGLAKALETGVTGDGGLICRSPASQAEAVLLLALLKKTYESRNIEFPESLADGLAKLLPPLLGTKMGDGGLASWQGARPMTEAEIDTLVAASGVRTRSLRQARDWGYQRVAIGDTVLICDAAPPPLGRVAGGGCASTLAFELSDGPARLVVSCGGANMGSGAISPGLAAGLRTTAAHSTLVLSDSNSTALLADGTLGKGVTEVELDRQDIGEDIRIEARHDGYAKRFGLDHKRTWIVAQDGREIHGEDQLLPAGSKPRSTTAAFALRFHLGPGVEASPTADGQGALLRIDDGPLWQFRCRGGTLAIDGSLWIASDGTPRDIQQLVVTGESPPGGANVAWVFRRAG